MWFGLIRYGIAVLVAGLVHLVVLAPAFSSAPTLGATALRDFPPRKAPPFPRDSGVWIGAPASWDTLAGRVVLLNVWTFG